MKLTKYPRTVALVVIAGSVLFAKTYAVEAQTQPDQLDRAVAREDAVAKCMRAKGLQYTPSLYPGESDDIAKSGSNKAKQQKRIRVPEPEETGQGEERSKSESERKTFRQAYWGEDGSQGCKAAGDEAVRKTDPRMKTIDDNAGKVSQLVTDRLKNDRRLGEESARYVTCMARKGYVTDSAFTGAGELRERTYADAGIGAGGGYDPKTPEGAAIQAKIAALDTADASCNPAWKKAYDEVNAAAQQEAWKSVGLG